LVKFFWCVSSWFRFKKTHSVTDPCYGPATAHPPGLEGSFARNPMPIRNRPARWVRFSVPGPGRAVTDCTPSAPSLIFTFDIHAHTWIMVCRGGSFVDGCGTAAQPVPRRCLRLFSCSLTHTR